MAKDASDPALPKGAEPLSRFVKAPAQLARRLAQSGGFDRFAYPDRTWLKNGSLGLTLRSNPRPSRTAWSSEPPRAHYRQH